MIDHPESRLWQTVLMLAVADTEEIYTPIQRAGESDARFALRKDNVSQTYADAIMWFDEADEDFQNVCELAGFDPDFIKSAYDSGKLTAASLRAVTEGG